jgi:hypothetical protein
MRTGERITSADKRRCLGLVDVTLMLIGLDCLDQYRHPMDTSGPVTQMSNHSGLWPVLPIVYFELLQHGGGTFGIRDRMLTYYCSFVLFL